MLLPMRTIAAFTITSLVLTSCLSDTYQIPKRDLIELAQKPPNQRGERVPVTQRSQSSTQPPEAPRVHASTVVIIHSPGHPIRHRRVRTRRRPFVSNADAKAERAWWWIVIAAAAAVGLAATEGRRFKGWVRLHPMHPVHLYGARGEYTRIPLAQIDPDTAAWAHRALVREQEGPFLRLARAPLERSGWTYALLLGASEIPSRTGDADFGFFSHIQGGYFFDQHIGLAFDIALGWNRNRFGDTVFDSRYAAELQYLPLAAGRLHAGAFGQVGLASRFEDGGGNDQGMLWGGGGLLQLDLTTYLAIIARAGVTRVHDEFASDLTVGVAVY